MRKEFQHKNIDGSSQNKIDFKVNQYFSYFSHFKLDQFSA